MATEFQDLRGATGAVGQAIADIGATVRHAAGKINSVLIDGSVHRWERERLQSAVADLEKLVDGINRMALDPMVDIPASDNAIGASPERDPVRPEDGNHLMNWDRGTPQPGVMGYGRAREVPEALDAPESVVTEPNEPRNDEGFVSIPPPPTPSYGGY